MRIIQCMTAIGFIAAIAVASPAAAVTSVKIIAADGTWIGATSHVSYGMMTVVGGDGWGCGGVSNAAGKFLNAAAANCGPTGSATVYMSGGEWWIDYP